MGKSHEGSNSYVSYSATSKGVAPFLFMLQSGSPACLNFGIKIQCYHYHKLHIIHYRLILGDEKADTFMCAAF